MTAPVARARFVATYYDASYFPGLGDGGGTAPPSDPSITVLIPDFAQAGSGPVDVAVKGTNFAEGCQVEVDGAAVPTVYTSATSVTGTYDPTVEGVVQFTVRNPSDAESNNAPFVVNPAAAGEAQAEAEAVEDEPPKRNGKGTRG